MEARKSYLEERQNEDNREARHILADQLGIDMKSDEQEKIHERRLLGLWFKVNPRSCWVIKRVSRSNMGF